MSYNFRPLHVQARSAPPEDKNQKVGPILDILSKTLSPTEFEQMVEQWRAGEREFHLGSGFIITCYTPKDVSSRVGQKKKSGR